MELAIIIAVVVVALVFDYTNGFHDAANAIATSVSTRALTPRVALGMAAVMNFVGAFLGQKVARTVSETISPPSGVDGLVVVLAGLLGAIAWNLITWYFGLPSSSSHALIGGLVGAAIAVRVPGQLGDRGRQGAHPDGPVAAVRLRARLRADARDHVGLPPGPAGAGQQRLPDGPDGLGGGDGARARPPGRAEDDGRDLPGAG